MEKLTLLGTGSAMVTNCYNTCFTLSNEKEHFLVDAGGGNTILSHLQKCDISIHNIHNVFISHSHNDHITGIIWIVRAVAQEILNENYTGNLYIYSHKEVLHIIRTICDLLLQKKFTAFIDDRIILKEVYNDEIVKILDWDVKFFNINSNKHLQFGFNTTLKNDKTFTFLGDEPYTETLFKYANKSSYLLHEAFCLYSQRYIFKPYEKFHSTVKDACENAHKLQIENVILYHSEDKNLERKKELYIKEGKEFFKGNILVPEDLEVIYL